MRSRLKGSGPQHQRSTAQITPQLPQCQMLRGQYYLDSLWKRRRNQSLLGIKYCGEQSIPDSQKEKESNFGNQCPLELFSDHNILTSSFSFMLEVVGGHNPIRIHCGKSIQNRESESVRNGPNVLQQAPWAHQMRPKCWEGFFVVPFSHSESQNTPSHLSSRVHKRIQLVHGSTLDIRHAGSWTLFRFWDQLTIALAQRVK